MIEQISKCTEDGGKLLSHYQRMDLQRCYWRKLEITLGCWRRIRIQFRSVTQSCLTLCDPMNHSMPVSMCIYIFYSCIYNTNIQLYVYYIYTHIKREIVIDVYVPLHMYILNNSSPEIMTPQ